MTEPEEPRVMHEHVGDKRKNCGECNMPYSSSCHYWDGKNYWEEDA